MNEFTWLRPGAVGDILMTMNLVDKFVKKHNSPEINFKCHPQVAPVVFTFLKRMGFKNIIDSTHPGTFGTQINLVGYPLEDGYPYKPMKHHLIEYFAKELGVEPDFDSFILDKPAPPKNIPEKYVTVHAKAGWSPYKNWKLENWNMVCWKLMNQKIPVVQLGGPNDPKLPNCMGRIQVPSATWEREANEMFNTCLGAMANATVHMGVDSWSNHATNIQWRGPDGIKRTPGVILWGSTQVSASGYKTNKNISKNLPCQPCFREDPNISSMPLEKCPNPADQTYENPKHQCMADITVKEVFESVMNLWESQ